MLFGQSAPTSSSTSPNIVPNPSFEEYDSPPIGWFYKGKHFTEVMKYWSSATGASPDVFGPKVRVPRHWSEKGFGQQKPSDGKSMAGITVYGCENGKPHCREYIQIQLAEPLVVGQQYQASFAVSHLPRSLQVDQLGMYFSMKSYKLPTDEPIPADAQVSASTIIDAAAPKWTKITGIFKATEASEYLLIGNFRPDSLTQVNKVFSNSLPYAYYYIDDVDVRKIEPILEVPIQADDLSRIKVETGKVVRLKNIFFDHDKAVLLPRSFIELNKLVALMHTYSTMRIELGGHTDSVGKARYNVYLSRKRAKAVRAYLIDQGIHPRRIQYKGYGSEQPIATNDTSEGRQLNRRVEFLILSL